MINRILLSIFMTFFLLNSYGRDNQWNKDLYYSSNIGLSFSFGLDKESSIKDLRRRPKRKRKQRHYRRIRSRSYRSHANRTRVYTRGHRTSITHGPIDYYTNSRGHTVQSPTRYSSRPPGATAMCRDGTYSFSHSRRGTCSGHGGVAIWF